MRPLCSAQVPLSSACPWPPPTPEAAAMYEKASAAADARGAPALALESHLLACQEPPCPGLLSPAAAGGSLLASSCSTRLPEERQSPPDFYTALDQSAGSVAVAAAPAPPPTAAAEAEPYVPHRSDLFRAGNIIDGRFKVIKRLADGGFAVVYRATDLTTRNEVAVKVVCHCTTGREGRLPAVIKWRTVLSDEYLVYLHLGAVAPGTPPPGIPSALGMGKELLLPVPGSTTGRCSLFSYLAMEQLGPDLWNLTAAQLYTSPPTDHLFVDHGLQMLQALQSMHKLGLVHADVKAENFAISHTAAAAAAASGSLSSAAGAETHSTDQRKVYLLDMGFAHPWQGDLPNLPRRPRYYKGTPATSSISSMWHHGRVTPRDDCEALGYALLEMWLGDAPWVLTTDEEAAAGWSDERLKEMAEKKCTIIHQGFAEGTWPTWFYSWWSYITHPDLVDLCSPVDYKLLANIIIRTAQPRSVRTGSTGKAMLSAAAAAGTAVAAAVPGRRKAAWGAQAAAAAAGRLFGVKVVPTQSAASFPAAAAAAPAAGTKRKLAAAASDDEALEAADTGAVFWQQLEAEVSCLEEVRASKQPKLCHNKPEQQQQQMQQAVVQEGELNSMYKVLLTEAGQGPAEE